MISDGRLARRAAKGDRAAFEAIYRRYQQDLYRFCLAMAGNPQDAQDALQNTMVKVLRALPGETRRIQLKPWLYRIARNETVELLRGRREGAELDLESAAAREGVAETAEARDRLRRLIADLRELPERQRAALVMREMAGLGFEQIGESFETSAAVARQTVYEARLGLRQMEAGREMSCEEVTRALSDADGRVTRRRDVRAHLRACERCRAFRDGIAERRGEFAAIAPLPLALSAGLLHGALSAGGGAGVGAAGTATGAGAGAAGAAAVATPAIVKSAATAAVVAAVGVTAADRGGLVDAPVLGERGAAVPARGSPQPGGSSSPPGADAPAKAPPHRPAAAEDGRAKRGSGGRRGKAKSVRAAKDAGAAAGGSGGRPARAAATPTGSRGQARAHGGHRGKPEGLPAASRGGQEKAGARKAPQARTSPGPPAGSGGGADGKGRAKTPPAAAPRMARPPKERAAGQAPDRSRVAEPPAHGKPGSSTQGAGGRPASKP